jgi:3-oxoadipate enol-lactonase
MDYQDDMEKFPLIHSISLITSEGGTLAVKAAGSGPPIIFLHGFPLNSDMWLPLFELLQPYFHCIAPDFRGFGGSTLGNDYQLSDLAQDIETIRKHLAANSRIHLVGLSMGGYVALEYWRMFGDHLHSLTLTNTRPNADNIQARDNRRELSQKVMHAGVEAALEPMINQLLADGSRESDAEKLLRGMIGSCTPQAIVAAQSAMTERRDFSPLLCSMVTRTLVVAGQNDCMTPSSATKQWAEQIPNGRFAEIPGSGHLSPLESPAIFFSILFDFLNSLNTPC